MIINFDQLLRVTGLTVDTVNKHLPTYMATIKGHVYCKNKMLRSTDKKTQTCTLEVDMFTTQEVNTKCDLY